ncbi:hypothetical protein pEaSNUABM35_00164 [Erwinia phage pEa_SNUABM_35]|uniref:Uncharacterized protein n=1 Tax=Erwinia phage pEa_SNUABM_35 TaxID=2869557 RepID=A0AAE7XP80_9CAUD|nr:hypothetical protein MPK65_gp164 [Erwinia phage pEa_SNUABM_35]QZE60081.1 hypothetical protein pEaSNUABM35_00164 [Erwinia phage pEa_SNUABM_35]QZE60417.1 hypothetical protein pEaSNUABM36_00164 [Erwinia phage pEa_SNUABM_36]
MNLNDKPQHVPGSLELPMMLREALKEKGFTLTTHPDMRDQCTKIDLRLDISLGGAATSTVDATYETYSLEGVNYGETLEELRSLFGSTIVLVAIDRIEPQHNPLGRPMSYIFRDCIIYRGQAEKTSDIQTIYLAMKGQYPNIPAFADLTVEQKTMITTHIGMLVNYIED